MDDQGRTDGQVGIDPVELDQAELAEGVEAADHPRRGDRRPDSGQEYVGNEQEETGSDAERQEKDPIKKSDPQPDDVGQPGIGEEVAGRVEKLQPVDELMEELEDGLPEFMRKRLEDDGRDLEGLLPEEIKEEAEDEKGRGDRRPDDPPEDQVFFGLGLDLEDRSVKRPGEKEDPQERAHREHVEDALDDDRADEETGAAALFLGQIKGFDELSDAAGQHERHGESHRVGRDQVAEAGVGFLMNEEIFPTEGAGPQMKRGEEEGAGEPTEADLLQVPPNIRPIDAPKKEKKEDGREKDSDDDLDPGFPGHDETSSYHKQLSLKIGAESGIFWGLGWEVVQRQDP